MESWKTMDDYDFDMFTISEFTAGQNYKPSRVKKPSEKEKAGTEHVTNTTTNTKKFKSLYDFDDLSGIDEAEKQKIAKIQYASSAGRGYVVNKYNHVNKSNNVMSHRVLAQTERDIREVCPMGYSNEVIEATYKNNIKANEKNYLTPTEEFKFTSSSDVSHGAIPKKLNGNMSSKEIKESNDLPLGFVEYDIGPNFKLSNNQDFPQL